MAFKSGLFSLIFTGYSYYKPIFMAFKSGLFSLNFTGYSYYKLILIAFKSGLFSLNFTGYSNYKPLAFNKGLFLILKGLFSIGLFGN